MVGGVFGFDGGVLFHGAAFGGVLNLGLELIEHRGCEDLFLGVLGGVLGLVVEAGADGGVGDLLLGGLRSSAMAMELLGLHAPSTT